MTYTCVREAYMMKRLTRFHILLIALLTGVATPSFAQDNEGAGGSEPQDASPAREPTLYDFDTTGFTFDLDLFQEPVVRESSNTSQYAVTVQRRAGDGLALGTDGLMAFVRMTQTIEPLDQDVTVELLQQATLEEAIRSIRNAYGELNQLETTPVTYEFLGEIRNGIRIDVGYLEVGVNVYVECYSLITESGNGMGIILKYHEPVDDLVSRDVALVDQLLSGLEVKPISRDSYYDQMLGDYQVRIPVISSLKNAKKLNRFVTEATIAYEFGSLRFQMIEIPENVDGQRIVADQLRGYEQALNQQRDRNQIEILWSNETTVPAGESGDALLSGLTHAVRMNDQEFLSTMYATLDGNRVVISNFSGAIERADTLHEYAYEFFKRPLSSAKSPYGIDTLGPVEFSRPQGLSLHRADLNSYVYAGSNTDDLSEIYASLTNTGSGYYQLTILDQEASSMMEILEAKLPNGVHSDTKEGEPQTTLHELADSRQAQTMTLSGHIDGPEGQRVEIRASGYLFTLPNSDTQVLWSAVSHGESHRAYTLASESMIDRLSASQTPGEANLSFATLTYNPSDTHVSRLQTDGSTQETHVNTPVGDMTIRVVKDTNDTDISEHITQTMKSALDLDELDVDSVELSESEYNGRSASVVEFDHPENERRTKAIGFVEDDMHVIIVVSISSTDPKALSNMLSMLSMN